MVISEIKSGLACLTGTTNEGHPIVCFKSKQTEQIEMNVGNIKKLLHYYSQVALDIYGSSKLVVVIDFSIYSNLTKIALVAAFHESVEVIREMLVVEGQEKQAGGKKKRRSLLVMVTDKLKKDNEEKLKGKKKLCACCLCSSVNGSTKIVHHLLNSIADVQNHNIELAEVGMNQKLQFTFNLNSWIQVRKTCETLVVKVHAFCREMDCIKAKVVNKTLNQRFLEDLRAKVESKSHKNTKACNEVVNLFNNPYSDPLLSEMESNVVFMQARRKSLDCLQTVVSKSREVRKILNGAVCKLNGSEDTDVNISSLSPDDSFERENFFKEAKLNPSLKKVLILRKSYTDLLIAYESCKSGGSFDVTPKMERDLNVVHKLLHLFKDFDTRTKARLLVYKMVGCMRNCKNDF